jgi:hypothetical protein
MKLKKVKPSSLAKFSAIMGLFVGLIYSVVFIFIMLIASGSQKSIGIGFGLGIVGVILIPIIYAGMGYIGGLIYAVIFNVIARFSGGIELEVEQ